MKVTNLETSKKLKELGFNSDYCDGYTRSGRLISAESPVGNYLIETPAYGLETILEALPELIVVNDLVYYRILEYRDLFYRDSNGLWKYAEIDARNESLANIAARLLIKLLQDNIIKLGE